MVRSFGLFVGLAVVWLLLSGYFHDTLILFFGFASCLVTVILARRMGIVDYESVPFHLSYKILKYWIWLAGEVAKANIAVTRAVFSDLSSVRPEMFKYKASVKGDLGLTILANSITLTPGTVTVDVDGDELTIHALTRQAADPEAIAAIDRHVAALGAD